MKIIAVKNKTPLSKLICWGLQEPVSHFAIVFDEKLVFGSNLLGVHLDWLPTVIFKSEVYFELNIPMTLDQEESVYQEIITRFNGKSYDYKLFAYFIYSAIKWRLFKKPIPECSPWNMKDGFLCTEILQCLPPECLPPELKRLSMGMISPWKLFNLVKSHLLIEQTRVNT